MKPTLTILLSFLLGIMSLKGQTNRPLFQFNDKVPNTSFMGKQHGNLHIYPFNETHKIPEIKIGRIEKEIFDNNNNRRFMHPDMKFIFNPDFTRVNGNRIYSLSGDNMPCLIPDKKGKLIILEPDTSGIFF